MRRMMRLLPRVERGRPFTRAFLPERRDHGPALACDDACVCPVHGTPLLYWPAGDDHCCRDVSCRYGHGMRNARAVNSPRSGT